MSCHCDLEPATFYNVKIRKARKTHRCSECKGIILPKEKYEHVSALWEGDVCAFKTCGSCRDLRTWVQNNVPCLCWVHGLGDQSLVDAISEAYQRAPEEVAGLRFGFARRIALRTRRNQWAAIKARIEGHRP